MELRKKVFELLRAQPGKKVTAREIALWVRERYPEDTQAKLTKSSSLKTEADLLQQLVAEIGANRPGWQTKHPAFKTEEGVRPRLYYWSDEAASQPENLPGTPPEEDSLLREQDLYPLLVFFLESEQVRGWRIDEKRASNTRGKAGNKWLFADVVGMERLTSGFDRDILDIIRESRAGRLRLWSFEVKRRLNSTNVREAYYQAVSNSSWANVGYLVATEIEGKATKDELQLLHAMHGIGIIRLNTEEPGESQILIPARERPEVAWAMCDRLSKENADFRKFMQKVRHFYQTGDLPEKR